MYPRMRLQIRLTFGQTLGQVDIWSDIPPRVRLWIRLTFGQTLDQVDIWSDVPPKMKLRIRLTFGQMAGWLAHCSWLAGWPSDKM